MICKSKNNRDGITLMFVLSMIVLFLLMGTTFVVVANDFAKASKRRALASSLGSIDAVDSSDITDSAFYMLVRGPSLDNVDSPLRTHSLLEDQYGYGFKGQVASAAVSLFPVNPGAGSRDIDGLLFQIPMTVGSIESIRLGTPWLNPPIDTTLEEYYEREFIGRVISITSGNASGFSSRILQHELVDVGDVKDTLDANDEIRFLVLREQSDLVANVQAGDEIIVNGRDFSGTGVGRGIDYDATPASAGPRPISGLSRAFPVTVRYPDQSFSWVDGIADGSAWPREVLRAADKDSLDRPLLDDQGLFPNRIGQGRMDEEGLVDTFITHDGSTNEPYDIPDFQNMFLSGPVYDPTSGSYLGYIPSFHRDSLYIDRVEKFAADKIADGTFPIGTATPVSPLNPGPVGTPGPPVFPSEYRSFSFRPVCVANNAGGVIAGSTANTEFYDNYPGEKDTEFYGTLALSARNTEAALDVDTDNDGRKDAVWIDIGLPVQTDAQGQSFRPLVAYKVIDMDSQLNLNVHGRATEAFPNSTGGGFSVIAPAAASRGLGVGVPEISLAGVFPGTVGVDVDSYGEFLYERYRVGILDATNPKLISDNLGFSGFPDFKRVGSVNGGIGGGIQQVSLADRPQHHNFGYSELTGYQTRMNYLGWPASNSFLPTPIFGTSGDTMGLGSLAYDTLLSVPEFGPVASINFNDPRKVPGYASDFRIGGGAGDSFYSASDLESLLRPNDSDTVLSASNRFSPDVLQHLQNSVFDITTHSFEIDFGITTMNVTDHLLGLLTDAPYNLNVSDANKTIDELFFDPLRNHRVVSNDLFRSGKMGINIVPEYFVADETREYNIDPSSSNFNPITRYISSESKYQFAKQFYCLALIVCGMDAPAGSGVSDIEYRTAIAQWAVNIVDFQDPDSVMTGFEFDLDPFDLTVAGNGQVSGGWEADGDLTTDTYEYWDATKNQVDTRMPTTPADIVVVWGAERPELLITETFAHHERRTEDLATDDDSDMGGTDVAGGDDDWDSRHVPQSSAYFELYNPWVKSSSSQNVSLLAGKPTASGEYALDDDGNIDRDPAGKVNVSAIAVDPAGIDPASPVWRVGFKTARADVAFERTLYFTGVDVTARGVEEVPGTLQYGTSLTAPDPIERGGYLVVGSSGNVGLNGGVYRTHFGRLQSGVDVDNTRGFGLAPGTNSTDDVLDGQIVSYEFDGSKVTRKVVSNEANVVVIDQAIEAGAPSARSFSLSDPVAGYNLGLATRVEDGFMIMTPDEVLDTPFDDVATGDTRKAIYNNGLTNNFRFAYLQRLANPGMPFDVVDNPYITIDSASFDLLAFNGIVPDQDNSNSGGEVSKNLDPLMPPMPIADGNTEFRSAERGESVHSPNKPIDPLPTSEITMARRQLFQTDFGVAATEPRVDPNNPDSAIVALLPGDNHNFSFDFVQTLGQLNRTYRDDDLPNSATPVINVPMGWMAFNNRPFMTAGELFNAPCLPPENITENYNASVGVPPAMVTMAATDGAFSYTMGIGGALAGGATSNRFDLLRDYLEVPSLFSSRRYLAGEDTDATLGQTGRYKFIDLDVTQEGMMNRMATFGTPNEFSGGVEFDSFHKGNLASESLGGSRPALTSRPPYRRGISDFRSPGKVNANTVRSETVWDAVTGGVGVPFTSLLGMRNNIQDTASFEPTDFPHVFTTAENTSFVPSERDNTGTPRQNQITAKNIAIRKGGDSSLLRTGFEGTIGSGSSFFRNQLRQRMSSMTTTRSSVFSVWITVGYFEVDQFGRVGAEVGSEIGEVKRDRAFYMFDRSVPMASEPGKNHNVDRGVLVRTIIN